MGRLPVNGLCAGGYETLGLENDQPCQGRTAHVQFSNDMYYFRYLCMNIDLSVSYAHFSAIIVETAVNKQQPPPSPPSLPPFLWFLKSSANNALSTVAFWVEI